MAICAQELATKGEGLGNRGGVRGEAERGTGGDGGRVVDPGPLSGERGGAFGQGSRRHGRDKGGSNSCGLRLDRGRRQRVEVVEVAKHRSFRHAGALRDLGRSGLVVAFVVVGEERIDHQLSTSFGTQPTAVDGALAFRRRTRHELTLNK